MWHHPIPPGKNTSPLSNDGFHNPSWLVWVGWQQWRDSGIIPHRKELMKLEKAWVDDLYLLDDMIERARPEPTDYNNP